MAREEREGVEGGDDDNRPAGGDSRSTADEAQDGHRGNQGGGEPTRAGPGGPVSTLCSLLEQQTPTAVVYLRNQPPL